MTDRVFPPLAAVSIAESGAWDSSGAESGIAAGGPQCAKAAFRAKAASRGAKRRGISGKQSPLVFFDKDQLY